MLIVTVLFLLDMAEWLLWKKLEINVNTITWAVVFLGGFYWTSLDFLYFPYN